MLILFDQGALVPIRRSLKGHSVRTAREQTGQYARTRRFCMAGWEADVLGGKIERISQVITDVENVVRAFRSLAVQVKLELGDIDGQRRRCGDHNAKHQKVLYGTL